MNVVVIGTGYVGHAIACLAEKGHDITLMDIDDSKVRMINGGGPVIVEEGLDEIIEHGVKNDLIRACLVDDGLEYFKRADVIYVAVGTPCKPDGCIDLSQINSVAESLGGILKFFDNSPVIAVKSTVLPGTTDVFGSLIEECSGLRRGRDFYLVMNPEFLREGCAVNDFLKPDSVVFGGDEPGVCVLRELYSWADDRIHVVSNIRTAESVKYFKNALLATKIHLANQLANQCEEVGVDYYDVKPFLEVMGGVAPSFFRNGPGFGGSCFPKDVSAINELVKSSLLSEVLELNELQALRVIDYSRSAGYSPENKRVCVYGLAFKPFTGDVRESPALKLIKVLHDKCELTVYDPEDEAVINAKRELNGLNVNYACNFNEAVSSSVLHYVLTDWPVFKCLKDVPGTVFFTHRLVEPDVSNYKYCLGSPLERAVDYEARLGVFVDFAERKVISARREFARDFEQYFNSIGVRFEEVVSVVCMDNRLSPGYLLD